MAAVRGSRSLGERLLQLHLPGADDHFNVVGSEFVRGGWARHEDVELAIEELECLIDSSEFSPSERDDRTDTLADLRVALEAAVATEDRE
jgi:hypothetical protein